MLQGNYNNRESCLIIPYFTLSDYTMLRSFIEKIPYSILIIMSVILGVAPFNTQPHLVEKVLLLSKGELLRAVDIFDLFFHSFPLLLLLLKVLLQLTKQSKP